MVPHEGTPAGAHVPAEWSKKILYATMSVGITLLMGSDAPVDRYQKPQGFSVSLQTTTPEEAERAFNALSKSGSVRMSIQETFFATRFGMLVDQFGIPWMINCAPAA
jgi:PhnB protein